MRFSECTYVLTSQYDKYMIFRFRSIILGVLIVLIAGFFYYKYFCHPTLLTGQAVLSWNISNDPKVKGYKVYYGKEPRKNNCPSGGYTHALNAGSNISYTVRNLEAGKTYYFSVTSYNDAKKESCFSEEMKKDVKVPFKDHLKNFFSFKRKK